MIGFDHCRIDPLFNIGAKTPSGCNCSSAEVSSAGCFPSSSIQVRPQVEFSEGSGLDNKLWNCESSPAYARKDEYRYFVYSTEKNYNRLRKVDRQLKFQAPM